MQEQQKKKKSVLGLRLSYMSEIKTVRDTIRSRMQQEELLDIMCPLTIEHDPEDVVIDFVADDKEEFAPKLNSLMPGVGDAYLREPEVRWDKLKKRQHDWGWWRDEITSKRDLRDQLHAAVEATLDYDVKVDAYGNYESPAAAVYDRDAGKPQLEFQTTERYVADPMMDKG